MPSSVGTATNGVFKYLKDRLWSRVECWPKQCLSIGDRNFDQSSSASDPRLLDVVF